ncbi:MAG: AMP-binding protein [Deltaproteobacteria bacterium]|nr:AMP-binding protein [Deltaproteobacteria bacterium]MBW2308936.1 AMP-binding protein [Deltaproteobacteria bacterium]
MKNIELLDDTIYGCFEKVAEECSDKPALICLGEEFSYSELKDMVLQFAASLSQLGVKETDRVILYVYNLPQSLIAFLALQRLGAIPIPVAPVYTSYDLQYLSVDSGAETIICMDTNVNYVVEILPKTPLKRIITTNILDLLPRWKRFLVKSLDRAPSGKVPTGKDFFSFKSLLRDGRSHSLPPFRLDANNNTSLMLYTGGTTGFPKGVPLTGQLFVQRAVEWRRASEAVVPAGQSITALAAPFYHIIGEMDAMTPLIVDGGTVIVFPRVLLDAMFDHIQRYRATNMFAVPALYRMILEHDRLDFYDLHSLKFCGTGGDLLPTYVGERWAGRFGVPLYQAYGATESCGDITACYSRDGIPPLGSIGKVVPPNQIRIVDSSTLETVSPGEAGELLVSTPYSGNRYWKKPEETADCFLNLEGEVWYKTSDVVRQDENGWCYFLDRSVDMIKHKGYRIAAAEIEKVLQEHPTVMASCVVGIPDEKVGERIKAFVVMLEDVKGASSRELMNWCRERLAPYKVPHYIEFRDMLPKSKVGKMLRREMRAEEQKKLEES